MLIHWIWFATLQEVQSRQKLALLDRYSDPEELFHITPKDWKDIPGLTPQMSRALENQDLDKSRKILADCNEKGISILTFGNKQYPARLRNIDAPPMVLYYKGKLPDFVSAPVIGVVGTRKATAYGLTTARNISRQIAACGALVVSGAADGIDAMAMYGALDAESPVIGVLGCGVDVVYPKKNRGLFDLIEKNGCLISEYPPGTQPYRWNFPQRNRIISGMSNGVLVVEAPEISGALITARQAWEQGRDVFAIPGNIDVDTCAGSNALLQERAMAACSGWDVVKEYAALYPGKLEKRDVKLPPIHLADVVRNREEGVVAKVAQKPISAERLTEENRRLDKKDIDNRAVSHYSCIDSASLHLTKEEQTVVAQLTPRPRHIDEIIAETGLPAGKVLSILTMLGLKGVAKNHPGRRVSL